MKSLNRPSGNTGTYEVPSEVPWCEVFEGPRPLSDLQTDLEPLQ